MILNYIMISINKSILHLPLNKILTYLGSVKLDLNKINLNCIIKGIVTVAILKFKVKI